MEIVTMQQLHNENLCKINARENFLNPSLKPSRGTLDGARRYLRRDYDERLARRHAIYRSLFDDFLQRSSRSKKLLTEKRYLAEVEIEREMWRDAPSELGALLFANELSKHFQLYPIAGFYLSIQSGAWLLKTTREGSLWRPRRDRRSSIFAIEVYPHAGWERPFLLTSRNLPFGSRALTRQERWVI
jgi:hypothetical protein